jgi:hypothetical protein
MAPFTWVFPGAFPVIAAAGFVVTAAAYQVVRNVARNPDFRWNDELKQDALAESPKLLERAAAYRPNLFRAVGESRKIEGGVGSDCRIFRPFGPIAASAMTVSDERTE